MEKKVAIQCVNPCTRIPPTSLYIYRTIRQHDENNETHHRAPEKDDNNTIPLFRGQFSGTEAIEYS